MDIESLKSKITDSLKRQQEASISAIQLRKQADQMEIIVSAFQGRIETLQELVREAGGNGLLTTTESKPHIDLMNGD